MSDNFHTIWDKFFKQRTSTLWTRFPGHYRAIVVETNDPLNMRRIRFKCPDMHDWNLQPNECPWAVPAPEMGSKRSGRWVTPYIGDVVWITFERGHPYGPIWTAAATPTRRKYYPLASVYQQSPISVDDQGQIADRPDDYDVDYLPKDGRPMSCGIQDRYGNLDISSAVGYFPSEHGGPPPPADFDQLQNMAFQQAQAIPVANSPDAKYMARVTKYGHMLLQCDQGYAWKVDGATGEFTGDSIRDEAFEIQRWKYLQRLINENTATGNDQRCQLMLTRYGTKFELRDTGWAQPGPISSKSRPSEYGNAVYLSKENVNDFRWAKLRTKGGWLLQAYDKGFDPQNDNFIKRALIDETGAKTEREDVHWADRDARWFRIVGRHGYKFVIDERGTDPSDADKKENPRGNGILLKGRRTGGCKNDGPIDGDPRGFYFEFNENDDANHTTWGTPLGQAIEMNDATEYLSLSVNVGRDYARPYRGLEENEFLLEPTRARDPELNSYHLVMDHQNEYLRLKTRGGNGDAARDQVNPTALNIGDTHQGLEAHDGVNGDGPWVELVDSEHRGVWLSRDKQLSIFRSKKDKKLYIWLDDGSDNVVIYNNEDAGKVQIYGGNVEIIAGNDISFQANNINFKAKSKVKFSAGGNLLTLQDGKMSTTGDIYGNDAHVKIAGVPSLDDIKAIAQNEATTRANTAATELQQSLQATLDGIGFDGSTDQNISNALGIPSIPVTGTLSNTEINFTPSGSPVPVPTVLSGTGDPQPGGDSVDDIEKVDIPAQVEPEDRATTYNVPSIVAQNEVEHPI